MLCSAHCLPHANFSPSVLEDLTELLQNTSMGWKLTLSSLPGQQNHFYQGSFGNTTMCYLEERLAASHHCPEPSFSLSRQVPGGGNRGHLRSWCQDPSPSKEEVTERERDRSKEASVATLSRWLPTAVRLPGK